MFKLAKNEEIGKYLLKKITKKYKSVRQFGKACIELTGRVADDDEMRNMSNRLSQIINGNKAVRIYDLPIFSALLDVSCEEILSAGQSFVPQGDRASNYSIAFSKDAKKWHDYINREDKLILNPDEYGKTAIDYALEFKNYRFIKFLIDNHYIWFDSRNDNNYVMTFGAGTSIERRDPYKMDTFLQYKLMSDDRLRIDVIALAIENNDIMILDELHARELPELYSEVHFYNISKFDLDGHYDEDFVRSLAKSSNEIIDYFTDEFQTKNDIKPKNGDAKPHTFMFPFISNLLDMLIKSNSDFVEIALKKAIDHNRKTYKALKQLIAEGIANNLEELDFIADDYMTEMKQKLIQEVIREFNYYKNGDFISFRTFPYRLRTGIVTNIVRTKMTSEDVKLKYLIGELNTLFEQIINIQTEFI